MLPVMGAAAALLYYTFKALRSGCCQGKAKEGECCINKNIMKDQPKVSTSVDINDIKETTHFCRCWQTKNVSIIRAGIIYCNIDTSQFCITRWWINLVSLRLSSFQAFCRILNFKIKTINKGFMGTFVWHSSWFAFPRLYRNNDNTGTYVHCLFTKAS